MILSTGWAGSLRETDAMPDIVESAVKVCLHFFVLFVFFVVQEFFPSGPDYSSRSTRPTLVVTIGTRGVTPHRIS